MNRKQIVETTLKQYDEDDKIKEIKSIDDQPLIVCETPVFKEFCEDIMCKAIKEADNEHKGANKEYLITLYPYKYNPDFEDYILCNALVKDYYSDEDTCYVDGFCMLQELGFGYRVEGRVEYAHPEGNDDPFFHSSDFEWISPSEIKYSQFNGALKISHTIKKSDNNFFWHPFLSKRDNISSLAKRSGVDTSVLYKLRDGKIKWDNISFATARKIAKASGVSLDKLWTETASEMI